MVPKKILIKRQNYLLMNIECKYPVGRNILVISNLYPSSKAPFYGSFVRNFVLDLNAYNKKCVTICVLKGRNDGHGLKKVLLYLLFYCKIFYRLLFFRYDLIYVHLITHASIPIRLVSYVKKLNMVFNIHGEDLLVTTPLARKLLEFAKPLLRKAAYIVVPSNYFKGITLERLPFLDSNKILVSASGGVKEQFYVYREYNPGKVMWIGYVSRVDRGKGWNTFVDAIQLINKKGYQVHACIIGGGLEVEEMKAYIAKKDVKNIEYVGPVAYEELNQYYSKMDLFVFPTLLRESLGLVGLEAMAASVPVIASEIGGITDYLRDGYNGFYFNPGDSDDLADKIRKFIELSDGDKKAMSFHARETANNYQSDIVSTSLFNILFKYIAK